VHRLVPLLLALAALLPGHALAQGEVKAKHGDWELRCDTPPGAQEQQCVIMQFVTAEDRENVGLSVVVMKTADKQARLLRVLAPLGVLLPRGLGLRIDDTDMGTTGFIRCLPNGCVSEVLMDENLIGKLRAGEQAMFIIFQTPEEGIGVPISLNGFGEGFDALP
jgi:invasion protein IalB